MHTDNKTISLHPIEERSEELINILTEIWETSVRATHDFLTEDDICEIRECVDNALTHIVHLIVAMDENSVPVGFMGVEDGILEMLFISPTHFKIGIGRKLVQYGIDNLGIEYVTANEQNPNSIGFYKHLGFKVFRRTERDSEGRPFPLIYMKFIR